MPQPTNYFFANVRKLNEFRPSVTSLVLFGLEIEDGDTVYLEIRFEDYEALQIGGDHLMPGLEEAMESAELDYGILRSDWREMSEMEIQRIPFVGGEMP